MQEDGFEFDKFIMVLDESYQPEGEDLELIGGGLY